MTTNKKALPIEKARNQKPCVIFFISWPIARVRNGKMTILHLSKTLGTRNQEKTVIFVIGGGGEEQKYSAVWKFLPAIQKFMVLSVLLVCLKIEGIGCHDKNISLMLS